MNISRLIPHRAYQSCFKSATEENKINQRVLKIVNLEMVKVSNLR